ncbi:MAG: 3-dehydroquinate synthase [Ruminococcus sp.]|nr:3-dehydroquinate synthase [Ruminococcus sp.]
MKKINVRTSTPYEVLIKRGSIKKSGELIAEITKSRKAAVITDDIVGGLYGETVINSLRENGFECTIFTFPNGEHSKNLSVLGQIFDFLCESGITRSDILVALGGGVVGDITGFAAASYLRGVDFVQIPTTLLAQVDSSVGGKTAIDISGGKNLVGAFKQPALVICDSDTLKTLTSENLSCGMAEVIKYGMIRDHELFEKLESHTLKNIDEIMDEIVYTCIDIKRDIVENDEFDRGERMILNFGHTLGHAIEGWHNYTDYTHGMGVAVGMCLITDKFAPELSERLKKCLLAYNLPTDTTAPMSELLPYCSKDKKRTYGNISYIVCQTVGVAKIRKSTVSEFEKIMEG